MISVSCWTLRLYRSLVVVGNGKETLIHLFFYIGQKRCGLEVHHRLFPWGGVQKTSSHQNNGDRNPPITIECRDTNGNASAVDSVAWWILAVSNSNAMIYISSDYITRQTIIQFLINWNDYSTDSNSIWTSNITST